MRCGSDKAQFSTNFFHDKPNFCFPRNFTKTKGKYNLINPGSVQDIHKNARNIMPVWIEGVEFQARKLFGINKIGYCNWLLSHSHPTGFRIGGTFQRQLNDDVLITPYYGIDINPSTFSTNFGIIYYPCPKLGLQMSLQAIPWNIYTSNFVMNYNGSYNTLSCVMHEPKMESERFILSHLYKINPALSIGSELMVQWFNKEMAKYQLALAGKYEFNKAVIAATCSRHALDVTYWKQMCETVQIGSSLVINRTNNYKNCAIFYQWERNNVSIRTLIDSKWTMGFTYSKLFENLSSSFSLSLYWCVPSNKFSCGFKFDLDDTFPKKVLPKDE